MTPATASAAASQGEVNRPDSSKPLVSNPLISSPLASNQLTSKPVDSTVVDERLRALSEELRCLVCQNQTLADSNAELAVDLRNQVRTLIEQGRDDAQIKTWLVERYGDFVLYKPPMQASTWLLWFGPFLLLGLGAIIWRRVQRAAAAPSNETTPGGSKSQLDAARRLLDS